MAGRITRRNCKKPKGVSKSKKSRRASKSKKSRRGSKSKKSRRGSKSKKSRRGSKSRKSRRGGDADSLSKALNRGYTKEEMAEKEKRSDLLWEKRKLANKIENERRAKIRENMEIEAEKKRIDRLNNPTKLDRFKNYGKSWFNKPAPPTATQ